MYTAMCTQLTVSSPVGYKMKTCKSSSANQIEEDKMPTNHSVQHRRAYGAMHTKGCNKFAKGGHRNFETH